MAQPTSTTVLASANIGPTDKPKSQSAIPMIAAAPRLLSAEPNNETGAGPAIRFWPIAQRTTASTVLAVAVASARPLIPLTRTRGIPRQKVTTKPSPAVLAGDAGPGRA